MSYIVKRGMISIVMVLALMALLVGTMMDGTSPEIRTYAYDTGDVIPDSACLTFTAEQDGSSVTINYYAGTLQYNNGGGWVDYEKGKKITLNNDEFVRFRGNRVVFDDSNHVVLTGRVACSGDVMSLELTRDYSECAGVSAYCFSYMFSDCTSLTKAPALSATNLAYNCCRYMFAGCTSLTAAPALPATTLADYCYQYMFQNCSSLTTAPELPATQLTYYCYSNMFEGCTNLTTAPALPATTLKSACYQCMFQECTSLTTAPELPATTLAVYCYSTMFAGCTNLTTAPALPATTLVKNCYAAMFAGCTNLTTAPALPATALAESCYSSMFNGCTGLTTAPDLPATALAEACYYSMFSGCTGLTTVPDLPARNLASNCYSYMFNGCSKFDLSATQDTNHTKPFFTLPDDVDGSQYASNMFSGITPQPGVTYYIHEEASQTQTDPAYTITIPAAVNIDGGSAVIGASGVTLPDGATIKVTISGANTDAESGVFTAKSESGNTMTYKIIADKVNNNAGTPVANGGTVLSINTNGDFTKTLTFEKNSDPPYAGNYTEALTFTVSVESA